MDANGSIWIYNCDTLEEELLFQRSLILDGNISHEIVSPTARYILIPLKEKQVKRKRKTFF